MNRAHVKGWERGTGLDGAWTCELSKLALASGNLAAVTALLDELTPSWREETDDPLAAVRGIADEAKKAWAQANADVIALRTVTAERDEARAKLAKANEIAEPCEDSRNENACGVCIACATVGRDGEHQRFLEAEASRVALSAKLAEAERERDTARTELGLLNILMENEDRAHDLPSGRALPLLERITERLSELQCDIGEKNRALTAAESALAGERKVSDEFRAACPSVVGEDRRPDGSVRACFFVEVLGNCESRLAIACLGYDDSRRRATTGGENIQRGGGDAATNSVRGSARPGSPASAPDAAAPSSSPAAPDFERRVESAREDCSRAPGDRFTYSAIRIVKAEDRVAALERALTDILAVSGLSAWLRRDLERALAAQPEAGR